LLHANFAELAWSGSQWVPVDGDGLPAGDVQVSNFETREEAAATARSQGLIVQEELSA
jgi:hypothetical protein